MKNQPNQINDQWRDRLLTCLSKSYKGYTAHFEVTSACNLSCIYCAVSQPGYKAQTIKPGLARSLSDELKAMAFSEYMLNGHGETTVVKGWHKIVQPLLDSSADCSLITNASRLFEPAEIDALVRLRTLVISCDTFDHFLYGKLRRGGSLISIMRNIDLIRQRSVELSLPGPDFSFSCVLGADNAPYLEEFILASRLMGVKSMQICSLAEYPAPQDAGYQLHPLSCLGYDELQALSNILHNAQREARPVIGVQPGVFVAIEKRLEELLLKGESHQTCSL